MSLDRNIHYEEVINQIEKGPLSLKDLQAVISTYGFSDAQLLAIYLKAIEKDPLSLKDLQAVISTYGFSDAQLLTIYLKAVEIDENAMPYVPENIRDNNFYLSAIGRNVRSILQVPEDKRDGPMYLAAIEKTYEAIQIVPEEELTEKMILEAVKQSIDALEILNRNSNRKTPIDVDSLSYDILYEVVKQNGLMLRSVKREMRDEEMCLAATQQNLEAIEFVPSDVFTVDAYRELLKKDWRVLKFIPEPILEKIEKSEKDDAIMQYRESVKNDWRNIKFVPDFLLDTGEFEEAIQKCYDEIENNYGHFDSLPERLLTQSICLAGVKRRPYALAQVPASMRSYEICLEAIKGDPWRLQDIQQPEDRPKLSPKEYETLCQVALKENLDVLTYVHKDFEESMRSFIKGINEEIIYFQNVSLDWEALKDVPPAKRNRRICLAAVEQNSDALQMIINSDDRPTLSADDYRRICLAAVEQNSDALQVILKQNDGSGLSVEEYSDICLTAFKKNPTLLKYVNSKELCLKILEKNPITIKYLPESMISTDAYIYALSQDWRVLKLLPKKMLDPENPHIKKAIEHCKHAIKKNWQEIEHIPDDLIEGDLQQIVKDVCYEAFRNFKCELNQIPEKIKTQDFYLFAVTERPSVFIQIPASYRTFDICLKGILRSPQLLQYIREPKDRPALTIAQYEKICEEVITHSPYALEYVHQDLQAKMRVQSNQREENRNLIIEIIKDWKFLQNIPVPKRNYEICLAAVERNTEALDFIKKPEGRTHLAMDEYKDICLKSIKIDPRSLKYIDMSIQNFEFYYMGIYQNSALINYIEKNNVGLSLAQYDQLYAFAQERKLIENLMNIDKRMNLVELMKIVDDMGKDKLITYISQNFNLTEYNGLSELVNLLKENSMESLKKFASVISELDHSLEDPCSWDKFILSVQQLNDEENRILFALMSNISKLPNTMSHIKNYFKEDEDIKAAISNIEKMIDEKDIRVFLVIAMIDPFTQGFGRLAYVHALLTCAQVATRKSTRSDAPSYSFEPTVISSSLYLDKYLQFIKLHAKDLDVRERFCLVGGHWRTGDIQIKKGDAHILLIDSIGLDQEDKYLTKDILMIIQKEFPRAFLFLDKLKRQQSAFGCSVFALDDLMHLASLEIYLKDQNLFTYFLSQNRNPESLTHGNKTLTIIPIELPLSLLRTMQYARLKREIIPARDKEKDLPVNKKGQTAMQSVENSYELDTFSNREFNKRLDAKLYMMARKNLDYFMKNPLSVIAKKMQEYTLEGFMTRYSTRQKVETTQPKSPSSVDSSSRLFSQTTAEILEPETRDKPNPTAEISEPETRDNPNPPSQSGK